MGALDLLNRLFIVVVSLIILVIAASFVVPYFIDWSQYRDRLEEIASEALGQDVRVAGDFTVRFLPQPRMRFDDVIVGAETAPVIEVASVEASFSLADFLRDRYTVTQLILQAPHLSINIDAQGRVANLLELPDELDAGTISVADAEIVAGSIQLRDQRAGGALLAENFNGRLTMSGTRGPFALQGGFEYGGRPFDGRVTTSALNDEGALQINGFMQPRDLGFSVALDGLAQTSGSLGFEGEIEVKVDVEDSESAAGVAGDVVFVSKLDADTRILSFTEYVLLPDDNRPATRMTGTATVTLGQNPRFDAALTGGVVALAERNVLISEDEQQYGLVTLLGDLPTPIIPPIPGTLSLELAELDAHAFNLRGLQAQAETDGEDWAINNLTARMSGNTQVAMSGVLGVEDGLPRFDGDVRLNSQQLSLFAAQWRKPSDNQALLNAAGGLEGRLRLVDGALVFDNGVLTIGNVKSQFGVVISEGGDSLSVNADLGAFGPAQSRMLSSLMPDLRGGLTPRFNAGTYSISAEQLDLWGLSARQVSAAGNWSDGALHIDRFKADDWGGLAIDIEADIGGDLNDPQFMGAGNVASTQAQSPLLRKLLDYVNTPDQAATSIGDFTPLAVEFSVSEPLNASQTLAVDVTSGPMSFAGEIVLSEGLLNAFDSPLAADISGAAPDAEALSAYFGLDSLPMGQPGFPVSMTLSADGNPANSVDVDVNISASGERFQFTGGTIITDITQLRGGGRVGFTLSDIASVAEILGAQGVGAGPVSGDAQIRFGGGRLAVSQIDALAAGAVISGDIVRDLQSDGYVYEGDLTVGRIGVDSLAKVLGGRSSVDIFGDVWPLGPFAVSSTPRISRGRVQVLAEEVVHDDRTIVTNADFEIDWDESDIGLRNFTGQTGAGDLALEVRLCCNGALLDRQLSGRATLNDVPLDMLLSDASAQSLSGTIGGGLQFNSTGASFDEHMAALTGEGSFSISGMSIEGMAPAAFYTLVDVVDVLNKEEAALENDVRDALDQGVFTSNDFGGLVTIAGGTMRVSNVVAEGAAARLIGGMSFSLADLGLDGRWTMTPVDQGDGRVASSGAEVTALVSGSYVDPNVQLDLTSLVEGVKFEAYGREVERLEALKAEQDARTQAAAEQRARLQQEMAVQLEEQRQAEEAARRRDAELRAAEEAAAERRRQEERQAVDLLGDGDSLLNPQIELPQTNFGTSQQF